MRRDIENYETRAVDPWGVLGHDAGMDDSLARLDACGQLELLSGGELSPRELVDAAIDRCEREAPRLGALVAELYEEARDGAAQVGTRAPLGGLPFLMKDVGAVQAGQPQYSGNRVLGELRHRAPRDSHLGARFRAAGLLTLGVSKSPEFGMQSTTQPLAFGPTRNPWDPSRSAGGSSGGACAAVAAGLVPLAHASDGAGSIRIPAAWCGVVGLKPSRGRIAGGAVQAEPGSAEFVVARSLRDVALALDVFAAPVARGASRGARSTRSFRQQLERPPAPLRIGLLSALPGGTTHPACVQAAEQTAGLLEQMGHAIEPTWPPGLFAEERGWCGLVLSPLVYRTCLRALAARIGRPVTESDVEPFLWEFADPKGPTPGPEQRRAAVDWLERWAEHVASWWDEGFDLLVTPTVPEPAVGLDELDPATRTPQELLGRMAPHMAFTAPFNSTGQPALTLPLHRTESGLPVGVQLVAARGREDLLLRVGAELERALPWLPS